LAFEPFAFRYRLDPFGGPRFILMSQLYEIRARQTMQNALLMGIWFLLFVLLAINMQIGTMAPQCNLLVSAFPFVS
jgi:hypothetical protein